MNPNAFLSATEALADLLEAENGALAAMDFPRVGCLAAAKTSAVAALAVARPPLGGRAIVEPRLRAAVVRLEALTRANQTLLQRAIAAHREVMGVIVAAARKSGRGAAGRYTAQGAAAPPVRAPIAVSARV
ncbi:MAG: hypothetical protein NT133_18325 [Alphaproteobacteria bacterium]|nr:hypothetical protein [Alphaproteobacteria bacterium]